MTNTNRLDGRTIGNVLIMTILLVAGVLLAGKAAGFVSDLWHGEPITISSKPAAQDYTLGQTIRATSAVNGATVEYTIIGIGNETAQILTTDDDGSDMVYRCPLNSMGNLDAMAKACTDETGHLGEKQAAPRQYNIMPLMQPAIRIEDDPECYYAQMYSVSCEDVKTIGREYFRINHPEVLDK